MNLKEWEIWHTYGSYFGGSKIDVELAAHNIVRSGFAPSALTSTGSAYWLQDGVVHRQPIELAPNDDGTATARIPTGATPYGLEGLYQSTWFLTAETKLFGRTSAPSPAHVRTMPGAILLRVGDELHLVHPVVKLFESGVVLVSLRAIGPPEAVAVDTFVDRHLNVTLRTMDEIRVPSAIAVLGDCAYLDPNKFVRRLTGSGVRLRESVISEIAETESTIDGDDFEHLVAPIPDGRDGERVVTVPGLVLFILDALNYGVSHPTGRLWSDRGGNREIGRASRWTGRPQVHLVRFDGQTDDADQDSRRNEAEFVSILWRGKLSVAPTERARLPENLRLWSDHSVFIASSASLWVQSGRGLARVEAADHKDPNRAHFVYENQAKAELLEYGYALHLKLRDEAASVGLDPLRALEARRQLADFSESLHRSSHYGEVQHLLDSGWREMGVGRLTEETTRELGDKEAIASIVESRRTNRWAAVLTCIFGIGAIPTIANDILVPIWTALVDPVQPSTPQDHLRFLAWATGMVFVAGVISLLWVRRR